MLNALHRFGDRLLGRGSAAITVPVMDGALKPNRLLDDAQVIATLPGIDDLASDGETLFASAGSCLYRLDGDRLVEVQRFDAEITALAVRADGSLAVALEGRCIQVHAFRNSCQRLELVAQIYEIAGEALHCVNALEFENDDRLLVSDGSSNYNPGRWCHDLMERGHTGRVGAWNFRTKTSELLARGQHYAFGVLSLNGGLIYSESWRHRIVCAGKGSGDVFLADLPGYPSRMCPSGDDGLWLTCFVCRTQLVEFVLREDAYRKRMLAEIDPRYWIAPALSSGHSFLEPLQGAGVKQMGVHKPWAPPRSYGLILRIDKNGRTIASLHSQVDGCNHGVTAVAELGGALYAASKGSGRLLSVVLSGLGESA